MARTFDIPDSYRSPIIGRVKSSRREADPLKRDLSPAVLDFGPVRFTLARHFGFCFGVENAIEIAYKTLEAHPDDRVFFLSEMIHNPDVNTDLEDRGVRFIFTPGGEQIIPWSELKPDDIVVVPAFGTTVEIQEALEARDIDPYTYNTTCPFVEKVWTRSEELGEAGYAVVVHGKVRHEETRATFSHSVRNAPTVIVRDLEEADVLCDVVRGDVESNVFPEIFEEKCSDGFDPQVHLKRLGVVNQTTMLATETREIARRIRQALIDRYGADNIGEHFADTTDTLCYATNENQNATYALIEEGADLAIIVGGYNSSNTSHIVDLCTDEMPTYFIRNSEEILSDQEIRHFDLKNRKVVTSQNWLGPPPFRIALTCGASCPDAIVDGVLTRVLSLFQGTKTLDDVLSAFPTLEIETA